MGRSVRIVRDMALKKAKAEGKEGEDGGEGVFKGSVYTAFHGC